jgi:hypothetical protein
MNTNSLLKPFVFICVHSWFLIFAFGALCCINLLILTAHISNP